MDGWQGSAIAVAGTLAGATLAYLSQRANALRSESFGRAERLRQERISAYSAFVGAATGLRQGVVSLWLIRERTSDGPEFLDVYADADRLGAAANHARLRVQLVADDPRIAALAKAAFEPIDAIPHSVDRTQLVEHERKLLAILDEFISAARSEVR
jgi:hypothetical protein